MASARLHVTTQNRTARRDLSRCGGFCFGGMAETVFAEALHVADWRMCL